MDFDSAFSLPQTCSRLLDYLNWSFLAPRVVPRGDFLLFLFLLLGFSRMAKNRGGWSGQGGVGELTIN